MGLIDLPSYEELQLKVKQQAEKIKRLEKIGEKYSKATEYFDEIMENRFVTMPASTQKLVNQVGKEILQVLKDK